MPPHREERTFSITFHLSAEFDPDYDGDDDGFVWAERFDEEVRPRLVAAVIDAVRSRGDFKVVAAPRGRHPEAGLDFEVRFRPPVKASPG